MKNVNEVRNVEALSNWRCREKFFRIACGVVDVYWSFRILATVFLKVFWRDVRTEQVKAFFTEVIFDNLSLITCNKISCNSLCGNTTLLFNMINLEGALHKKWGFALTLPWRRSLSCRNQSIDLQTQSIGWFLYDINLRHERAKRLFGQC